MSRLECSDQNMSLEYELGIMSSEYELGISAQNISLEHQIGISDRNIGMKTVHSGWTIGINGAYHYRQLQYLGKHWTTWAGESE